ncbi:MAG: hypothetical protein IPH04_06155 [Saprospirales bacterium]|nr:hypothetical protein [Saprospirales bacterium]
MRYSLIFIALAFVGALNAQLPIRNYLFLNQDSIVVLLDSEGLEYEVYETDGNEDSYGYDYNYEDEEVYYEDTSYYDGAAYGEEEESVQDEEMAIVEAPVVPEVVPDTILWPGITPSTTSLWRSCLRRRWISRFSPARNSATRATTLPFTC